MDEPRVGHAQRAVARRGEAQAEVDVSTADRERLVEAPTSSNLRFSTIMQAAETAIQLRVPSPAAPNGVRSSGLRPANGCPAQPWMPMATPACCTRPSG